jgi:NAD(P)-dependent dehydrogenase (short-subunit alcohol dehydrogenase family)
MRRLEGKVAFITGAGAGIARATARRFAEEGAAVVIAELDAPRGRDTEELVRSAGGDALFVGTDVTDEASVTQAVQAAMACYGRLDILHNCAGGSLVEDAPVTEVDWSVWDRTIDLDLKGTMLCCRHAIPKLVESGGGAVINMSSTAALQPWRAHVYSAAKGAIISLTRSLARQYGRHGVRVNAICPGYVLTERVLARMAETAASTSATGTAGSTGTVADGAVKLAPQDEVKRRHPFAVGKPEDIAAIAAFLASDDSRMITGTAIAADGGMANH